MHLSLIEIKSMVINNLFTFIAIPFIYVKYTSISLLPFNDANGSTEYIVYFDVFRYLFICPKQLEVNCFAVIR